MANEPPINLGEIDAALAHLSDVQCWGPAEPLTVRLGVYQAVVRRALLAEPIGLRLRVQPGDVLLFYPPEGQDADLLGLRAFTDALAELIGGHVLCMVIPPGCHVEQRADPDTTGRLAELERIEARLLEVLFQAGNVTWVDAEQALAWVLSDREEARKAADVAFVGYLDKELATHCGPCFEGICDICIDARGTAGDGQPCRCQHAGHYAEGLRWEHERAEHYAKALKRIGYLPCLTALLGESDPGGICGCPHCIAYSAVGDGQAPPCDAERQVDRLAQWILANVPGEPSQSQGAVDTAIRLLARTLDGEATDA